MNRKLSLLLGREAQGGIERSPFHGQGLPTGQGMVGYPLKHVAHCVFPISWREAEASFLPKILRIVFKNFIKEIRLKWIQKEAVKELKPKGK